MHQCIAPQQVFGQRFRLEWPVIHGGKVWVRTATVWLLFVLLPTMPLYCPGAPVTVTITDTVIAPKSRLGINGIPPSANLVNNSDFDTATGLSKTHVDLLRELKPATVRRGGLEVNGNRLESWLYRPWPLSYGPPPTELNDLHSWLALCRSIGADPFITIPPNFTDNTVADITDLNKAVRDAQYADHGNLVDYLNGDTNTVYGWFREHPELSTVFRVPPAAGVGGETPWGPQFQRIWFELGNEVWGTLDGRWDMWLPDECILSTWLPTVSPPGSPPPQPTGPAMTAGSKPRSHGPRNRSSSGSRAGWGHDRSSLDGFPWLYQTAPARPDGEKAPATSAGIVEFP
jgi:hypothetical protein